ncbi:MAG: aldehyde dehydrogenase family protein [Deltaproteobacteria bacterium]|nr:aldehyde dehydrogenase family protein [Deltaproteobacteria bacterium]
MENTSVLVPEGKVFLGGRWVDAPDTHTVRAPWDGAPLGVVGLADHALAERAVTLAHEAFPRLWRQPAHARRAVLDRLVLGLEGARDELASLLASEAGKPITLARVEVARAIATFRLSAEESVRAPGEFLALDGTPAGEGAGAVCARVPTGPVLAISPFHFPLNLVAHKLGPAFALGAPVVLKPAPQTPLVALRLASLVAAAGAPEGLLSVLPCALPVARALVDDPRLPVVSFTGSAAVGWGLRAQCPRKKVLLELGGNAAAVVEPDADLEHALQRITAGAFAYAGQVCIKVQQAYVHRDVPDAWVEALTAKAGALRVCAPEDPSGLLGPMIDEAAAVRVARWVQEAVDGGARVTAGGAREGNRHEATVVSGARAGMKLVDEEVFGPVLTIHRYAHLDEALETLEAGRYGLQAGLFTHDLRKVTRCFWALRVGALVVNDAPTFRVDQMPYGGAKDSGAGREGVRYAMEEFTDRRLLVLKGFLP